MNTMISTTPTQPITYNTKARSVLSTSANPVFSFPTTPQTLAQVGATFTGLLGDHPQGGLGLLKKQPTARWYPFIRGSATTIKGEPVSDDTVKEWAKKAPKGSCLVDSETSVSCAFPEGNASFSR
ncbi:MAG: hypothetical protein ACKO37_05590 [Vampirovibrionales bacterium]